MVNNIAMSGLGYSNVMVGILGRSFLLCMNGLTKQSSSFVGPAILALPPILALPSILVLPPILALKVISPSMWVGVVIG